MTVNMTGNITGKYIWYVYMTVNMTDRYDQIMTGKYDW